MYIFEDLYFFEVIYCSTINKGIQAKNERKVKLPVYGKEMKSIKPDRILKIYLFNLVISFISQKYINSCY